MPHRSLLLGVLLMALIPVGGALLAKGGPEGSMLRHGTDAALLSPDNPIEAAKPSAYAIPSDVSREHWTVSTPRDALQLGLLGPAADGKFHPSRLCTNEELSSTLRHFAGLVAGTRPECVRTPLPGELTGKASGGAGSAPASRRDLARGLAGVLANFEPAASKLREAMDSAAETFYDVPEGDPSFRATMAIRGLGLIRGWEDGGYHPDAPFTRAELAESLVWTWEYLKSLPAPATHTIEPAPTKPAEPVKAGESAEPALPAAPTEPATPAAPATPESGLAVSPAPL